MLLAFNQDECSSRHEAAHHAETQALDAGTAEWQEYSWSRHGSFERQLWPARQTAALSGSCGRHGRQFSSIQVSSGDSAGAKRPWFVRSRSPMQSQTHRSSTPELGLPSPLQGTAALEGGFS